MKSQKNVKLLNIQNDVIFEEFMTSNEVKNYKSYLLSSIIGVPSEYFLNAKYFKEEDYKEDSVILKCKDDIVVIVRKNLVLDIYMNRENYLKVYNEDFGHSKRNVIIKYDDFLDGNIIQRIVIDFDKKYHFEQNSLIDCFLLSDYENNEVLIDSFKIYTIDLDFLKDKKYLESEEDVAYLLKVFNYKEIIPVESDPVIEEANTFLEKISTNNEIVEKYEIEEQQRLMCKNIMITGIEIGCDKTKRKIAERMIKDDFSEEKIKYYTNISEREIKRIKNNLTLKG